MEAREYSSGELRTEGAVGSVPQPKQESTAAHSRETDIAEDEEWLTYGKAADLLHQRGRVFQRNQLRWMLEAEAPEDCVRTNPKKGNVEYSKSFILSLEGRFPILEGPPEGWISVGEFTRGLSEEGRFPDFKFVRSIVEEYAGRRALVRKRFNGNGVEYFLSPQMVELLRTHPGITPPEWSDFRSALEFAERNSAHRIPIKRWEQILERLVQEMDGSSRIVDGKAEYHSELLNKAVQVVCANMSIAGEAGYIFQFACECALRIAGNEALLVNPTLEIQGEDNIKTPDLFRPAGNREGTAPVVAEFKWRGDSRIVSPHRYATLVLEENASDATGNQGYVFVLQMAGNFPTVETVRSIEGEVARMHGVRIRFRTIDALEALGELAKGEGHKARLMQRFLGIEKRMGVKKRRKLAQIRTALAHLRDLMAETHVENLGELRRDFAGARRMLESLAREREVGALLRTDFVEIIPKARAKAA